MVTQTRQRSGWPTRRTLKALEVPPASFYRWRTRHERRGGDDDSGGATSPDPPRSAPGTLYALLASERRKILDYALAHPEVRHRELAWRMLDENVVGVSASSVYRVLREADLICRWKPPRRAKATDKPDPPGGPDQLWQTDIRYTKVGGRNYYLLSFLDVYSRYVVHHELLATMDGLSVSIEAAAALATLAPGQRPPLPAGGDDNGAGVAGHAPRRGPVIQSDHGSGFVAHEFAATLAESQVGHTLIRPHTPTDNGCIERYHRTIGERIDEHELEDALQAEAVIAGVIDHYNHRRLHSALNFLRPVDYYRGNPEALLAERRGKLATARELRKQENLKLRQRRLPWAQAQTVRYSEERFVSL
jgi:transposase InsO family protein